MEPERARAAAVAARLLASPALAGLSPLEKEEQALLLLRSRAAEMAGLLEGQGHLPGLSWEQARALLVEELRRATDRELEGLPQTLAARDGTFPFAASLQNTAHINAAVTVVPGDFHRIFVKADQITKILN